MYAPNYYVWINKIFLFFLFLFLTGEGVSRSTFVENGIKEKAEFSSVSFKTTEVKQLARQGIEHILPPKQTRRPLSCLLILSFFYVQDPETKGRVDQRLYFDMGVLYKVRLKNGSNQDSSKNLTFLFVQYKVFAFLLAQNSIQLKNILVKRSNLLSISILFLFLTFLFLLRPQERLCILSCFLGSSLRRTRLKNYTR